MSVQGSAWESVSFPRYQISNGLSITTASPTLYPTIVGPTPLNTVVDVPNKGILSFTQHEYLVKSHRYFEINDFPSCGICGALGMKRTRSQHRFIIHEL